jgi:hypothetical protein
MKKTGLFLLAAGLLLTVARAATPAVPDLKEVTDLLRANLPGLSDSNLNRAEVEGLLAQLHGEVSLVGGEAETNTFPKGELSRSTVLDGDTLYLRVTRVGAGLPEAVTAAYQQLGATNKLKGVVLDLRFAEGADYPAAAAVAGLFLTKVEPLFSLGGETASSIANKDAIKLPVAVLVNGGTRGAGEVLAGILRETRVALILGSHTGGGAAVMHEFPLKDGQRLRIATTPVQYANGAEFSQDGLEPDIAVSVSPAAEQAYFADAYAAYSEPGQATNSDSTGLTNEPERRISEADLVKARRAGADVPEEDLEDAVPATPEPQQPVMHDPVLVRALDLVKGLALLRQAHGD